MDEVTKGKNLLYKLIVTVLVFEVICALLLLIVQLSVSGAVIMQLSRSIVSIAISAFLFFHLYNGNRWARFFCLVRFGFSAIICFPTIMAEPDFLTLLYSVACLVLYTLSFTLLLSNKDILSYIAERSTKNAAH